MNEGAGFFQLIKHGRISLRIGCITEQFRRRKRKEKTQSHCVYAIDVMFRLVVTQSIYFSEHSKKTTTTALKKAVHIIRLAS